MGSFQVLLLVVELLIIMIKLLFVIGMMVVVVTCLPELEMRSLRATGKGVFVKQSLLLKRGGLSCPASGSELSSKEKKQFLRAHNDYRKAEGKGLKPLKWNDALAKRAQDLVDSKSDCKMEHIELNCGSARMGQNLAWDWRSPAPTGNMEPAKAVTMWYDEKKDYNYAANSCSKVCGHYTQVVWKDTKEVGCAARVCGNSRLVACDYYPPGNWVGEKPY